MDSDTTPSVSVVIVNWNTRDLLLRCIRSIKCHTHLSSVEIIVVDNNSVDGSSESVELEYPDVILILNASNLGFSKANNIGIGRSKGRFIALVNSDIEVLDNCLDELCAFLEANANIGMAGPRILWPDRSLQSSCRRFPSLWNNLTTAVGVNRLFPKWSFFAGEHMFYFPHDSVRTVDVLVGCFVVAKREAVESVGFLDERFFIYSEDVDWSRRFHGKGWAVVFYPGAEAVHDARRSSSRDPVRFALEYERAVLLYWRKYHGIAIVRGYLLIRLIYHFVRMLPNAIASVMGSLGGKNRKEKVWINAMAMKWILQEF